MDDLVIVRFRMHSQRSVRAGNPQTSDAHSALDVLLSDRIRRHEDDGFPQQVWTRAAGSVAYRDSVACLPAARLANPEGAADDVRADQRLTRRRFGPTYVPYPKSHKGHRCSRSSFRRTTKKNR